VEGDKASAVNGVSITSIKLSLSEASENDFWECSSSGHTARNQSVFNKPHGIEKWPFASVFTTTITRTTYWYFL